MWERERDSREVRGHRADVKAAQPLGSDVRTARRGKAPRPWGAVRAGIYTQDGDPDVNRARLQGFCRGRLK